MAKITLTQMQKDMVKALFAAAAPDKAPSIKELTHTVFGDTTLDGRSDEGKAIKDFLSELGLAATTTKVETKGILALTDEQKEYIRNHRKVGGSPVEIAREVFQNPKLINVNQETRSVQAYIDELDQNQPTGATNRTRVTTEEYRSPKTISQTLARINKYLNLSLKEESLKREHRSQAESLKNYLSCFRFEYEINKYSKQIDRDLFEDAFIRYVYDKEDLTQEELDQFIDLCTEVVIGADILRRVEEFRNDLEDQKNLANGNKITVSMSLNEAINSLQTEYNQCKTRGDKLYKNLTGNRAKRLELRITENSSVLNLVKAMKDQEYRGKMADIGDRKKEAIKEEVDRLASLEDLKCIIKGASPDILING